MSKQRENGVQVQTKRLSKRIRLLPVLYRILIILGLVSLALSIFLLAFNSRFSFWILLAPGLIVALGILLAWIEYKLHNRHYQLLGNNSSEEDADVKRK